MPIRCHRCGYDRNRDTARFCGQCGKPLAAPQPASPAAVPGPLPGLVGPATPPQGPVPPVQGPLAAVRAWLNPPAALEGRVLSVDGPHKRPKRGQLGKLIMAMFYNKLVAGGAWLAAGDDVDVRYLRVMDGISGQSRAVVITGTPSSDISVGDDVAFWGHDRGGALHVKRARNQTTGATVALRR